VGQKNKGGDSSAETKRTEATQMQIPGLITPGADSIAPDA